MIQTCRATVKETAEITGIGLHTGQESRLAICPSEEGGIVFETPLGRVPALAENVRDVSRGTTLGCGEAVIMTTEHLMSALWGAGIDSALVRCSGCEVPVLDGSSRPWFSLLEEAGRRELGASAPELAPASPLFVSEGGAFIGLLPGVGFSVEYFLDYPHPMIGARSFLFDGSREQYREYIAPSRTFVLYEEIKGLYEQNLAKGGSVDNCIVVFEDRYSAPLRHGEELVCHKILDLAGDLFLCGAPLGGRVIACKSGHRLNTRFAALLRQAYISGTRVP